MPTNTPKEIPGYRFAKPVFKPSRNKLPVAAGVLNKARRCGICSQEYTGYVKIKATSRGLVCSHNRPALCEDPHLTAGEQKRIGKKLKPNETAVKGNDGVIRILEK